MTWRLIERLVVRHVPRDFHAALLIVVDSLGAGRGVNRHAAAAGDEADDVVAGKGLQQRPKRIRTSSRLATMMALRTSLRFVAAE